MNRPLNLLTVAIALIAALAMSLVVARPWATTVAQGDASLYVSVTELRFGWTPDLPAGGTCGFTGQQFGLLSTVPMHIVVEDETHRTIAAQEVIGTILHNEGEDWYRCDATFDLPLPEAAFYTIRINDVYHSTVSADRVGFWPVTIVLESGESWRPAA